MKVVGLLVIALASGVTGCSGGTGAAARADAATDAQLDERVERFDDDVGWTFDARVGDDDRGAPPETSVDGGKTCIQATEVRRSCHDDWDCVAELHVTDCCGSAVWVGIRASAITSFDTLEAACERSYSACTCAARLPTADDGSIVHVEDRGAVSARCQGGACKTFAPACGHGCDAGH
jgi:hypothetical protein